MKVWVGLYLMVWLVLVELLVAIDPRAPSWSIFLHAGLGVLIVALAAWNFVRVRESSAPGRTKRTIRATFGLCVILVLFGTVLWAGVGTGGPVLLDLSFRDVVQFLHALIALAIFAQAASAATAFDMWEEREFEHPSVSGTIPAPQLSPA